MRSEHRRTVSSAGRGRTPGRVVGIDGGATRTRYLMADGTGGVLARSEGAGSLLGADRDAAIADALFREVGRLAEEAGTGLPVDAICAGLAGAESKPDAAAALERRIVELAIARRARVVSDAEVAFVDAFGDAEGVLLIAGTGSIALARSDDGTLHRVGGWGALLGDEGGGYRIGLEGLQAAIRGAEGRGEATRLTESLFATIERDSVEEVLEWSRGVGKAGIAALAPIVITAADDGDGVAAAIVEAAADGLVRHVVAVHGRAELRGSPPVALTGGLIGPEGPLRGRVVALLEKESFPPLRQPVHPARGAVRLALRL